MTDSAVTLGPQRPKIGPVALLVISVMMLGGCSATCESIAWKRQAHPELPAPAARYVMECGSRTAVMDVAKPPACLGVCFGDPCPGAVDGDD